MTTPPRPAGSYGNDAPWVPWLWIALAVAYVALAVCGALWWETPVVITVIVVILAALFAACGALFWYATLRGKFLVWDELLANLDPSPRRVLDLGCGRGAVSIMIAHRFPYARVEGIDLWRSIDQSGNSPEAAASNARENGVADRVHVTTGDMTQLPFADEQFDLVTASLSIHNIPSAAGRRTALHEAWRVLSPGGRLLIVDIGKVREYPAVLRDLSGGAPEVRGVGWRMWWSGPWMATRIVTLQKR
ncbi:class I SAM-dependent methyltransferase [Microbacterium sp.]|uniref:class I SAM-dependent methyltransferase n=1 Tax=Microbacterium sp. TaxID=51671 RepID=UPI0039E35F28